MPQVQIQIVTWNSKDHLERLFSGLEKQVGDFDIVIIDNDSKDGTAEWLRSNKPNVKTIQNQNNRGFAAAHNQGFAICQAPYVLVLNPDTELQPGYLAEVLSIIESNNKITSVQGKLYRQLPEGGKCGNIDSCGLKMKFLWRVVDIGQNKPERPDFGLQKQIFGATGACALYRTSALKQVADKHGIFDERFGSYKEDVDLAWRLKRAGYQAIFTPRAIAWHERGVGKGDKRSWRVRWLSWRNQVLMVMKNLFIRKWKIENGR